MRRLLRLAEKTAQLVVVRVAVLILRGGALLAGADPSDGSVLAGFADLRAIELLSEGEVKTLHPLQTATQNEAVFLGITARDGTLQTGKQADMVLVGATLHRTFMPSATSIS